MQPPIVSIALRKGLDYRQWWLTCNTAFKEQITDRVSSPGGRSLLCLGDDWTDGGLLLLNRSLVHTPRLDRRGMRALRFVWLLREGRTHAVVMISVDVTEHFALK